MGAEVTHLMPRDAALEAFAEEANRPEGEINLARAALLMCVFEYPDLDVPAYLNRIDRLAVSAGPVMSSADVPALALAQFLFRRMGFTGDQDNYHDPRNSFLNQVLDRRTGIPITLSVLYVEVARRLGVQAQGVGLPGHFIVRATLDESPGTPEPEVIYLDPFHGGALLDENDCRERVNSITGGKLPFTPEFLRPVGSHYILLRMLNNLKNSYAGAKDLERALRVVERLLVLKPGDPDETRNLGLLHAGRGHMRPAIAALERYLELRPDAPDAGEVRGMIAAMGSQVARWN